MVEIKCTKIGLQKFCWNIFAAKHHGWKFINGKNFLIYGAIYGDVLCSVTLWPHPTISRVHHRLDWCFCESIWGKIMGAVTLITGVVFVCNACVHVAHLPGFETLMKLNSWLANNYMHQGILNPTVLLKLNRKTLMLQLLCCSLLQRVHNSQSHPLFIASLVHNHWLGFVANYIHDCRGFTDDVYGCVG